MKSTLIPDLQFFEDIVARVRTAHKYRYLGLPEETIRDLITQALATTSDPRIVEKVVRKKLHNLVAPYLGDPDYANLFASMATRWTSGNSQGLLDFCTLILQTHASTRERLKIINDFYPQIFALTGVPQTILDLACGLNPFTLPWMGLKPDSRYFAFDLHKPRIELIQAFFKKAYPASTAIQADILVNPPQQTGDVAFLFKEAQRFEQRQKGSTRKFLKALHVRHVLVSLPTANLTGKHPLFDQDRRLIDECTSGTGWLVNEILFENEIVFCIEKSV